MIIQGANTPLVITFDEDVTTLPKLLITLWCDMKEYAGTPIKTWEKSDVIINGRQVALPLTEDETSSLPTAPMVIEAKGMNSSGATLFWDQCSVSVKRRRDKDMRMGE